VPVPGHWSKSASSPALLSPDRECHCTLVLVNVPGNRLLDQGAQLGRRDRIDFHRATLEAGGAGVAGPGRSGWQVVLIDLLGCDREPSDAGVRAEAGHLGLMVTHASRLNGE